MPNFILDLEVNRVDLVEEGANSEAFIKLYKRKENVSMDINEILAKMLPEHAEVIKAEIAKAKAEVPETTLAEITKAKEDLAAAAADKKVMEDKMAEEVAKNKTEVSVSEEDVIKGLDPAVQEIFKSLKASGEAEKAKKEAAEEVVKQLNVQKMHDEAVIKAKDLRAIPVAEEKLIAIVKSVSPEVLEILKTASTAIESSSTFEEFGKGKDGDSDAWANIEKKADELLTTETKLTRQQAIARVVKDNAGLYKEYLKGVK